MQLKNYSGLKRNAITAHALVFSVLLLTGCSGAGSSTEVPTTSSSTPSPSVSETRNPSLETTNSAIPDPTATAMETLTPTSEPSEQAPVTKTPQPAPSAPESADPPAPDAAPAPTSEPELEAPARENGNPNSFMSFEPQELITTSEQAIDVMMEHFDYNPDFIYNAIPNEHGNFDVTIRSLAIIEDGGSGTVGIWEVEPNGNRFEKGNVIR